MKTINDRIQYIIDQYYNKKVTEFCRDAQIKQPTMNDIVGGRKNKPSYDIILKIVNANAVTINIDWLITGNGPILKNEKKYSKIIDIKPGVLSEKENCINCERLTWRISYLENDIEKLKKENTELIEECARLRFQAEEKRMNTG